MEENANDIMETISNLGRILLYVFIGMAAFFIRRSDKRAQSRRQFDFPNADPETPQPLQPVVTEQPKPAKKVRKQKPKAAAAKNGYFTYENEADYRARTAERKEQTEKQTVETESQGSTTTDFDLRTAVIASEILKPKFEDWE